MAAAGNRRAAAIGTVYGASSRRRESPVSTSQAYRGRVGSPGPGRRGRGSAGGIRGKHGPRATSAESDPNDPGGGGRAGPTWRCRTGRGACCDEVLGLLPKLCLSAYSVLKTGMALAATSAAIRYG